MKRRIHTGILYQDSNKYSSLYESDAPPYKRLTCTGLMQIGSLAQSNLGRLPMLKVMEKIIGYLQTKAENSS